ncbi:MAG: hypothetical protein Q9227_009593 [Pyrenula ochraceoflavens]
MSYLRDLQPLTRPISAAGGITIIVTADAEENLDPIRKSSGYSGVAISDPENSLAEYLKGLGLLQVAVSKKGGFAHGMAQPGVLVVKRDGVPLFQWAIEPGVMNMGGAKDRPVLEDVWEYVQSRLSGNEFAKRTYRTTTVMGVLKKKIFG